MMDGRIDSKLEPNKHYKDLVLSGSNLAGCNLSGSTFVWCSFYKTDLSGANLEGASFKRVNLQEANLNGANLTNTKLRNTSLSNIFLNDAQLKNTDICGSTIEWINTNRLDLFFAGTISDDTTKFGHRFSFSDKFDYYVKSLTVTLMGFHSHLQKEFGLPKELTNKIIMNYINKAASIVRHSIFHPKGKNLLILDNLREIKEVVNEDGFWKKQSKPGGVKKIKEILNSNPLTLDTCAKIRAIAKDCIKHRPIIGKRTEATRLFYCLVREIHDDWSLFGFDYLMFQFYQHLARYHYKNNQSSLQNT